MGTPQLYALTSPLLTTSDGRKMGKSAGGAVWLNGAMLSPYEFWQFWRNTDDRDVGRFLRLFTDLPMDEIGRLEALDGSEINAAKIALANAATELCRGADAAALAAETARKTFEEGASGEDLPTFDASSDISVIDALVALNFVASKKEARRMIQGGGARVEGDAVTDEDAMIAQQATPVKISAGKKKHGLIQFI